MNFTQIEDYQPLVCLIQAKLANVLTIYAFGSQVQGTANQASDLDLAILVTTYTDSYQLWDLSSQLADIVACPVDLLDMRLASTVMQYQILQTGLVLWSKPLETGLFESFVLSEKLVLETLRKPLLDDIQQRRKIYA
jgi:predicted nucleotidyltransferase